MIIELAGEHVELRAERAIYWPKMAILFVADCHLGKAESFRRYGVPIPRKTNANTLQRLTGLIATTRAERLVILGDFWHHAAGMTSEIRRQFQHWIDEHRSLTIDLILGNHDRCHPADGPENGIRVHSQAMRIGPFIADHYPSPHHHGYCLAGHIHPGFVLRGKARQSLSLPCFWLGPQVGVLPAFGSFIGQAKILPKPGDRVFVIADQQVFATAPALSEGC